MDTKTINAGLVGVSVIVIELEPDIFDRERRAGLQIEGSDRSFVGVENKVAQIRRFFIKPLHRLSWREIKL